MIIMDKNLKIVYLDRVTAGPINLKERFSKYGEYIEYGDTDSSEIGCGCCNNDPDKIAEKAI